MGWNHQLVWAGGRKKDLLEEGALPVTPSSLILRQVVLGCMVPSVATDFMGRTASTTWTCRWLVKPDCQPRIGHHSMVDSPTNYTRKAAGYQGIPHRAAAADLNYLATLPETQDRTNAHMLELTYMGSGLRQLPEPGKTLEFVSSSPCFGIFWRCCYTITPNLQCLMSRTVI